MWKEIKIDEEDEELDRIADLTNEFSCWADPKSVVTDNKVMLRWQLSGQKYPYRCFIYKDDTFEILKDFRYRKDLDMWELMRFAIKWDTLDSSINPMDAILISTTQTKTFLEEIGKKIFLKPFSFDNVETPIDQWYKPEIVDVARSVGVSLTYQDNGKYWEWELL